MTLSIISAMAAEELWKIYTYFTLKLFSKCHIAQQKKKKQTKDTLLRGQQAQHRALKDAQSEQTLQAKGLYGHKTLQDTAFFWFFQENRK